MARIHPAIARQLDAFLCDMILLPPEAQQLIVDCSAELRKEIEQARWAKQTAQARILGEYEGRLEYGQKTGER